MKRLKTEDIVDLEIFIRGDEKESEDYKIGRDFKFYAEADSTAKRSEMSLLYHWIGRMRNMRSGRSIGFAAALCFKLFSFCLFVVGALLFGVPLANAFFVQEGPDGIINVSYFFITCVFVPFILLLTAIFLSPLLGELVDMAISAILGKFFKKSGGLRAVYSSNKKWLILKSAICAQYLGIGIAVGIFSTQLFRPMFNEYAYGWRTTLPQYVTAERVHGFVRVVSLPWALFAGEGVGYPTLEQVRDSRISSENSEPVSVENPSERYEKWSVFFILSSFTYGVLFRILLQSFYRLKISRTFSMHRIRNDRKISEIMRRMLYSSKDSALELSSSLDNDGNDTAVILRSDLDKWRGVITDDVKKFLNVQNADVFNFEFGRELFGCDFENLARTKKNLAFVYLSDDYNAEVFETIEALVDKFPEKFISVHLLGRLSPKDGTFNAPPPVEKSWWERKINSVSSRNLKLF